MNEDKYEELNEVADKLIEMSGLDLFKNTRVTEYVELRSLACYLFRVKMNITLIDIAKFFKSRGKSMDHATVIHSVKRYSIYRNTNSTLKMYQSCFKFKLNDAVDYDAIDRITFLQQKCKKIAKKNSELKKKIQELNYKKDTYTTDEEKVLTLLEDLPKTQIKEVFERIRLLKKSWAWKSKEVKDRCEIIESSAGLSDRAY